MNSPRRLLIILAFVAFVSLGLPDGLLGVAWPSVRHAFGRAVESIGILVAAGTSGYLLSSFFAGQLVKSIGVGRVLVASCLLVTAALTGNALAPGFVWMIPFAFIGGLGGGAIDAGINVFAAARFSPRVVNWLHACWGIGASSGPLLLTVLLHGGHSWRWGYGIVACVLAMLSALFVATAGMWRMNGPAETVHEEHASASIGQALGRPMVWVQILLFFIYCGIETTAGQLFYTLFIESRGIDKTLAGLTVGGYWAALTVGRIVFGQLSARLGDRAVLRIGTILTPAAAMLAWWNPTTVVGLTGAVVLGFGLAPIFPTLISVTPRRVGRLYAAHSVGFQVAAAALGIMVFPNIVGQLSRTMGLEVLGGYLAVAGVTLLAVQEAAMRIGDKE